MRGRALSLQVFVPGERSPNTATLPRSEKPLVLVQNHHDVPLLSYAPASKYALMKAMLLPPLVLRICLEMSGTNIDRDKAASYALPMRTVPSGTDGRYAY